MHYVSERPCLIKDHVHMVGAKENERDLFKQQALKDWEKILISRSKELVSGGRFVCINFGIDERADKVILVVIICLIILPNIGKT